MRGGRRAASMSASFILRGAIMLRWALFFAIVAVIAGLLGFTGIAAGAATIAKFLFVLFLILCVVFLVLGFVITKKAVD